MKNLNDIVQSLENSIKEEFAELHQWLDSSKIKIWKFYTWVGTVAILVTIQQFKIPRQVDWILSFLLFMSVVMAVVTLIDVFVKERRLTDHNNVPVTGTDPEDDDGKEHRP